MAGTAMLRRGNRLQVIAVGVLMGIALSAHPSMAQQNREPSLPEGLSALPELIAAAEAEYPPAALADGVQADVLFEITIDVDGSVARAVPLSVVLYTFDEAGELIEETIAPDEDPYGFVEPALEAMGEFVFDPALDDEAEPIAVDVIWRFGFYFDEEEVVEEEWPEQTEGEPAGEGVPADVVNFMGRLYERGTRTPIGGAEVVARPVDAPDDEGAAAMTDAEGLFAFRGLAPGQWQIEIAAAGYETVSQVEEIVARERTEVTYRVERADYGEYTFEVRESAVQREVSRQALSVVEINRVPGNSGDAVKVIQNLPGFARPPFNAGLIVIRGSAPEDSRSYIEGIWVPLIYHFGGLTSVIQTDLLSLVEYLPGAFSVAYGRGTGGVINVETRPPQNDRIHGVIDVDIFDASVLLEGPIAEGWSFFVGARRSYIDAILPLVIPDDAGFSLSVAPRYWDYQAKLQFDPNPQHSFNLLALGSFDTLEFLIEEPPDDPTIRGNVDTTIAFHRLRFEWQGELSDDLSNRLAASVGVQSAEFAVEQELFFLLDTIPFTLRNTLEWRPSDRFLLRPGVDIEYLLYDISVRLPRPSLEGEVSAPGAGRERIEVQQENQGLLDPAVFVEAEWELLPDLTLIPGVRTDFFDIVDAWSVDGRLAARYRVSDALTLEGAVGTFHQAPQVNEADVDFGNPDLGLEWAVHYVLGGEYSFTDYLGVDLQLFYKDLNDLVSRSDAVIERDGEPVLEIYNNEGDGRVYGLELLLRHNLANNFFGWISYTLSRSERRDQPGEPYRLFTWDQTHILTLVASYELPRGWAVGARFRLVSGVPVTPIIGATYDADFDYYVRIPGETLSDRIDPFHQLDIRVDKRFVFDRWLLDIYLDVSNVYNRANPETIGYNFDYSESAVVTGLPIIPSFGIRGSF